MSNISDSFDLRVAWRRHVPAIERDAELFWSEQKVLGPETSVADRSKELCIVAYQHGQIAAVSTAGLRQINFLGARVAMFRCTIAKEFRGRRLSYELMTRARQEIEAWSAANLDEKVMAMATIAQTKDAHLGDGPGVFKGSGLTFVGWTANGERMRVAWFKHARIPRFPPGKERPL
jgi:hypothetical protein